MRIVIFVVFALFLAGCSTNEELSVISFKVGKADSHLISQGNEHVLIDAAEEDDGEKIVDYLQSHNISSLKALIITHFDKDHVGGADFVLQHIPVETVYVPDYESDHKQTKQFWEAVEQTGVNIQRVTATTALTIGKAEASIIPPNGTYEGDNDFSLVTSIVYDDTSFYFAGDVQAPRIQQLLATGVTSHTFLKVPHHGRFNEKTIALLEAVQPDIALITSSDKNPESGDTVEALQAIGAEVYTTRNQHMMFISDGHNISVIK